MAPLHGLVRETLLLMKNGILLFIQGLTSQLNYFFDGELINELDINQTTPLYGNEIKGYVGCRNNFQQFFKGYIDDVQLYNYAISQDDIIQLLGNLPTNIGEKYSNDIKIYPILFVKSFILI